MPFSLEPEAAAGLSARKSSIMSHSSLQQTLKKKNTAYLGACDHEPLATIIAKPHLTATIGSRSDTSCAGLPEL
jgi:hypothetical protein